MHRLNITFFQLEELVSRQLPASSVNGDRDLIRDFRHLCYKQNKQVTVAIRESGVFDLYWNNKLVLSSADSNEDFKYTSLMMNFTSCMLMRQSNDMGQHRVFLSLEAEHRTSLSDMVVMKNLSQQDQRFYKN